MVIVTKDAKGALLKAGCTLYSYKGYQVAAANTLGSGDSFLAGYGFSVA